MTVPQQVQELIDGSGNNFHAKVARWFRDNGWRATVSPYYMDQSQQKAREIDLVVERAWQRTGTFGDEAGVVLTRLFVECKFVPAPAVFWFTEKNSAAVEQMLCDAGPFRPNNSYTQKHHYLAAGDRAAKLFTSSNSRGAEAEPFYKALNQSLNGLVSMRNQEPWFVREGKLGRQPIHIMDYPVVVCSSFDEMYAADFDGQHPTTQMRDNFQLEVQYAFIDNSGNARDELFLIDFIEFARLPALAAMIETDARAAGVLMPRA